MTKFTYKKPKDYAEFVTILKALKTDKQKIEYIILFFKNEVKYNYEYLTLAYRVVDKDGLLWTKGQMIEAVNLYAKEIDIESVDEKGEYHFPTQEQRIKNINRLLQKIKNNFPYSADLPEWWKQKVLSLYGTQKVKTYISAGETKLSVIKYNLLASVGEVKMQSFSLDGDLITTGVCLDFANFICKLCKDIGIECKSVRGTTGSAGHAWNLITINGKELHYDVTYSMFVRDCYNGWNKKAKWGDFEGITYEQLKQLNPERVITYINGEKYEETNPLNV